MPRRVKKLPLTAARKVRMREEPELQQRKLERARVQPVASEQRERKDQQAG